jgi:hypothetical protein
VADRGASMGSPVARAPQLSEGSGAVTLPSAPQAAGQGLAGSPTKGWTLLVQYVLSLGDETGGGGSNVTWAVDVLRKATGLSGL